MAKVDKKAAILSEIEWMKERAYTLLTSIAGLQEMVSKTDFSKPVMVNELESIASELHTEKWNTDHIQSSLGKVIGTFKEWPTIKTYLEELEK